MLRRVFAVEYVRRLRGGSQPHLLRCSDGQFYIVKFQNNPQGKRILANELLGTKIAERLNLLVSETAIVVVDQRFIKEVPALNIQLARGNVPCHPGTCFGSRFLSAWPARKSPFLFAFDDLAGGKIKVRNLFDFAGMLVFDKWVCNTDRRQIVLSREKRGYFYRAFVIDQGACFNGEYWNFPDGPLYGIYRDTGVYSGITGIEAFQPWISKLHSELSLSALREVASDIPEEWYDGDAKSLAHLLTMLDLRRRDIIRLLENTRDVSPQAFPNWKKVSVEVRSAGLMIRQEAHGVGVPPNVGARFVGDHLGQEDKA